MNKTNSECYQDYGVFLYSRSQNDTVEHILCAQIGDDNTVDSYYNSSSKTEMKIEIKKLPFGLS